MATLLPLSLVARSLERLNVAMAIMITLKHMRVERLLSIQVDCLVFQSPRKVHRKVQEELAEMTYDRLHLATRRPLSRYVGPLQDAIASKEFVYQLKTLDQPMEHGGELTRHDGERPSVHVPAWVVHTEPVEGEGFAQQIIDHVLGGLSCCITGPPGTGKSHVLGQLAEALKAAGQTVQILAPTNAAARIVGGSTIHNFSTRMASSKRGYSGVILIDEISMVSLGLLAILDQLRAGDCQIVCSGDWDQLPPVGNSWRGKAVDPLIFQDSHLLEQWSGSTHFKLTRCRRSDKPHFQFYTSLNSNLATAIAWTKLAYKKSDEADLHLVISHAKRRSINSTRQGLFAQGRLGVSIPAQTEPGYMCVAGTPLVGT